MDKKAKKYAVPEWYDICQESNGDRTNKFTNTECSNSPGVEFLRETKTRFNLYNGPDVRRTTNAAGTVDF